MKLVAIAALALATSAQACTTPTGITQDGSGFSFPAAQIDGLLGAFPNGYMWLPFVDSIIGRIVQNETPIQFRNALYHGNNVYNAVAMYHPTALDTFGRGDLRRCSAADSGLTDAELARFEKLTAAYAFAYSAATLFPDIKDDIAGIMDNALGLSWAYLENPATNTDLSTPWGLAKKMVDDSDGFSKTDGWNKDGSLGGAQFNKLKYSDFSYTDEAGNSYEGFSPSVLNIKRRQYGWQPLVESDNLGYFTRQDHVTPFIGATAKVWGTSDEEFMSFRAKAPEEYGYSRNYEAEADFVLNQTQAMATDDFKKMGVELFDGKFTSILPIQINWSIGSGLNEFDFWFYDMALVTAMYDAVILVWREKVQWDRVRPTTIVHGLRAGETVNSYAGPFNGAQDMRAEDWQPYVRTMPHGEYPSGSSCVCAAYAELITALSGSDTTAFPLQMPVPAGSSKGEPGAVPENDILFSWNSWSEVADICGESRLWGGMHFAGSVPAGADLCTGTVAPNVVAKANLLKAGDASGAFVDINDDKIRVRPYDASPGRSGPYN